MARTATIVRETSESKVELSLNLDGTGKTDIDTSVPFYNHMMTALGKHSLIDLKIKPPGTPTSTRTTPSKTSPSYSARL